MATTAVLYEEDFVRWAEEQTRTLRRAAGGPHQSPSIGQIWPRRSKVWAAPLAANWKAGSPL